MLPRRPTLGPMSTAVVTGANRGIGLALVEALLARGDQVIAACRQPSARLTKSGAEVVDQVDVSQAEGVARLAQAVGQRQVDLLINNAGILVWGDDFASPRWADITRQFEVNAVGALRVTHALQGNLAKGSKIAFVTSRMGSVGDNTSGGHYGYRMSKAAMNIAAVSVARDLAPRGIAVAVLHPGMVSTEMIGGRGQIEPQVAAQGLLARIDALTLETSGSFWHQNGEALPW